MELKTILFIFIAVAIAIGCLLLGKVIFETKPIDYNAKLDSLIQSSNENKEKIRELELQLQNNETGIEVHKYYYEQKKDEIKKQSSNNDYKDVINYLDTAIVQ